MLSNIIHARVEEIFQQVYFEIRSSGYSNKLIGGIVITGGGSMLKHLKQLVEYHTGLSARVGYPTEYIAQNTKEELKNPMYATGIGLIIKGIEEANEQGLENLNLLKDRVVPIVASPVFFEEQKKEEVADVKEMETVESIQEEVAEAPQPVRKQMVVPNERPKRDSWIKGLLTNVKDWFEDDSVNKDFE
jgi:cell division ATPase FtsA